MAGSRIRAIGDSSRLALLRSSGLLDSPAEPPFDRLSGLAARVLNAPVALISLLDEDREVFKSSTGLPAPWRDVREVPLADWLGQYVLEDGSPFVIPDATLEPRLLDHMVVKDLGAVAYAAVPLDLPGGETIGVLAVIDSVPRAWSDADIRTLMDVAASVITEVELRLERSSPSQKLPLAVPDLLTQRISLRQILDGIPEGILIAGPDQRFILCNAAGAEILGSDVTNEDSLGAIVGSFLPREIDGSPIAPENTPIARALLHGETVRGERILIRKPDTLQDVPILISSAQLRGADGTVAGAVATFQDITEISQVEQQKDDFVATVSHDLRSPITAIRGHAQMLQRVARRLEGPEGPRLLEGLSRIEGSTRQMVQILDDLVDLAYLAINRDLAIRLEPTDLAALARDAAADYQERSESHRIKLELDEDLLGRVDGPRLRRVLDNLLSNAIKYSPDGGEILLRLSAFEQTGERWARIDVIDHGVGIPANDLPNIFNRYSRGGNVGGIKGTGLGLAGVRQIVLQHGGSTEIESEVGRGTTVTVKLPLDRIEGG